MSYYPIVKGLVQLVSSLGASAVTVNVIKATTPVLTKTSQKVLVTAGSLVVSSMVSDAASTYAGAKMDELTESIKNARTAIKDAQNNG